MASAALFDARQLVAASVRCQADLEGLWQEHRGMRWWQSGLSAMAANLVVDPGTQTLDKNLQALAEVMIRGGVPAGWLVWPDQQPGRQHTILEASGFRCCEQIWLASLDCQARRLRDQRDLPPWPVAGMSARVLSTRDVPALVALLKACHGVPESLAAIVATTFAGELVCDPAADPAGVLQLRTFAVLAGPSPVSSITAAVLGGCSWGDGVPRGGLLWLGTHPQWRCRGLARQVTRMACSWLIDSGVHRIHVQAAAAARSLYDSLGFEGDGVLELWGFTPRD